MRNKVFREIGYWSALGAAALSLINCIIYLIKGIKILDTELNNDPFNLIGYPSEHYFDSAIYKVSLGILAVSFLMTIISFLINTDGALRIIMIIAKALQIVCIGAVLIGIFILHNIALLKIFAILFAVMELISLILYIIERDHRKTIIRVIVFSIFTIGGGFIFSLFLMLLFFVVLFRILYFIYVIFKEPEHKTAVLDLNGKVIGWLKRE